MSNNLKTRPDQKSKAESSSVVDEQIDESFPASDPPSSNAGGGRVGEPRRDKDKTTPKPEK